VFAGYAIDGEVGRGSTGVVWRATQLEVDRKVAIKQLAPELAHDDAFRERFRAEARALASLTHPNIVAVYDYVEDGEDAPYIVEEWVDGATLEQVVVRAGKLTPPQAVGVLRGALTGLVAAHAAGAVHGDISSTNILVDIEGTSKLVDFGLTSPSTTGSSGTPAYASPEACSGEELDARSDVYSAGCVLFELLTGEPPYSADSLEALAVHHATSPVPKLPGSTARLSAVVERALAKNRDDRYPDAAAFLAALEDGAERDLGAGWLAGASIATLAVAAQVSRLAGAGAGAATPPASATTSAGAQSSKVASFIARRRVPLAIGGATLVLTVVAVVAAAGGGGEKNHATVRPITGDPAKAAAIARQRGQNGGAGAPASGTAQVDLTASGGVTFHITGTKATCGADGFFVNGTDYPEVGDVLNVSQAGSTKASVKWLYKNGVNYLDFPAGITIAKNPTKVVLNGATIRSGNGPTVSLSGVVTCPS
jgi:hypothetical protein